MKLSDTLKQQGLEIKGQPEPTSSTANCLLGESCACAIGTRHFWFEAYCKLLDSLKED